MSDLQSLIIVLAGIAIRLVIPILITGVAVHFLRRLDASWQSEAKSVPLRLQKPACWEIMGCSPARRKNCPGRLSALPCWQARRLANGYLREECLSCKVFLKAPMPSLG
jgi:hypothetical protein